MNPIGIEQWPPRLERARRSRGRVVVLEQTESTQDAARRLGAQAGDVVVAWRQTAGRGRLGRAWADTAEAGIAATFVVAAAPPGRSTAAEGLALASAVGTAHAAESLLGRPVGIKWPNDIVVEQRKLAGILIEVADDLALIGIGVNVSQDDWPPALARRAVSLRQLGASVDRLEALEALLPAVDAALGFTDARLVAEFSARDVLRGTTATFRHGTQTVTGTVSRIDPTHGLVVQTRSAAEVFLPAATTRLVPSQDD